MELRGITIKDLRFKQKLEIYAYLLTPTVQGLIIKSKKMADSLYIRGFGIEGKRTYYRHTDFKKQDIMMLIALILMLAITLTLHFLFFRYWLKF